MKILVTGNLGYVGPVLVEYLRRNLPDSELIGYDTGYFGHCLTAATVLPETVLDRQIFGDVRDITAETLQGVDAVVHLAAISNDPMGNSFEAVTEQINDKASIRLAELAKAAGVGTFVFASSCSMYGSADGPARCETDPVAPLTAYARSKVAVERALSIVGGSGMKTTCLRFATACGMSPRLRLDLVLNDFVACALASGVITVLSDGSPWRPLVDVEDMARAIHWAIVRPTENGGMNLSVNVGRNEWNYQVKDLAQAVAQEIPGTSVNINTDAPPDKRSYRVDFSLFASLAPAHIPQVSLGQSICRLRDGLQSMDFSDADFRSSQFMRLKVLQAHLEASRLTPDLRWSKPADYSQQAA